MRKLLLLLLVPAGVLVWWIWRSKTDLPTVPFAKAIRETLVSTLPTNGKVEPVEWAQVRSGTAGLVDKVLVQQGQAVERNAVLARLSAAGLDAELSAAQARLAQARADLATIEAGGKSSELTEIENQLSLARLDRDAAQREYEALRRLAKKNAATALEVQAARDKLRETELQIAGLERRRAALIGKSDRAVALARVKEAEAAVEQVRSRIAQLTVRTPVAGVVYTLSVRPGAYVNIGDPIATVGRLERLRVRVYVDEPELGRVQPGQPVTITWDALPGKQWRGVVERMPSEVVKLETRQVGEVLCTIDNPGRELVPGTNVNAEIRSTAVPQALTIPKEALRRDSTGPGVFRLEGDAIHWRRVATGASSITRVQITSGLAEGDAVALSTERALKDGQRVRAVF